jgi:hypothetical protein
MDCAIFYNDNGNNNYGIKNAFPLFFFLGREEGRFCFSVIVLVILPTRYLRILGGHVYIPRHGGGKS